MDYDDFGQYSGHSSLLPVDEKLIAGATEWIAENKPGYFGECARCGADLDRHLNRSNSGRSSLVSAVIDDFARPAGIF
jgi:hypothetical protein